MKYIPKDTRAYFDAAPQFHAIATGHIPVENLARATRTYRENCGLVSPDAEAVNFYALNHCASIVRREFTPNEVLPVWAHSVLDSYVVETANQGQRLLHYLFSIITRESRHLHGTDELWASLEKVAGPEFLKFAKGLDKFPHEDAAVANFQDHPPACSIAQYAAGMAHLFDHGKWSSSYGGKPWGRVAKCALDFVTGHTSLEMLVDTAYTLAHNNGPIFNKTMMYQGYSNHFIKILDVQRSGQIPELVLGKEKFGIAIPDNARVQVARVSQFCDKANFGKYVDWFKVEALGSLHKYPNEKTNQKKLHPDDAAFTPTVSLAGMEQKIKITGTIEVFPGQTVEIFERVAG